MKQIGSAVSTADYTFFSFDSALNQINLHSTSKEDVALYEFEVRVTLTSYGTKEYLIESFQVAVLAECPDSIISPLVLKETNIIAKTDNTPV